MESAYFAGGCFWCVTPVFAEHPGVAAVTSGYCGGQEADPTYEQVKKQKTGHRETVWVEYDPARVSYRELLALYLDSVDPFDPDGQFVDRGYSYTLAVYCRTEEEFSLTREALARLEAESGKTVYVSVEAFQRFYTAEEEHQDYYRKHPEEFRQELIQSGRITLN